MLLKQHIYSSRNLINLHTFFFLGLESLSESLKNAYKKQGKTDLTIIIHGPQNSRKFTVHKSILKACSPKFNELLSTENGVVRHMPAGFVENYATDSFEIYDVDPDIFNIFLLSIYAGKAQNVTPDNAVDLYKLASEYRVPVLKNEFLHYIRRYLTVSSLCTAISLALEYSDEELFQYTLSFFSRNTFQVLNSTEWNNLMVENPSMANYVFVKLIKDGHLQYVPEEDDFELRYNAVGIF